MPTLPLTILLFLTPTNIEHNTTQKRQTQDGCLFLAHIIRHIITFDISH